METQKIKIDETIRGKLKADFPPEAYSAHPTKTFLTTLKAMYITERLNDVFGIGRWYLEHSVELTTNDYVLVRGKLILLDYECEITEQFGGHKTTGSNTEIADGYKSAVTDIISKSASYLEIGIDMFKGKIPSPKSGNKNNTTATPYKNNDTIKFGSAKDETLKWLSEDQFNAMKTSISNGKLSRVITQAVEFRTKRDYREELNKLADSLKS